MVKYKEAVSGQYFNLSEYAELHKIRLDKLIRIARRHDANLIPFGEGVLVLWDEFQSALTREVQHQKEVTQRRRDAARR